MFRINSINGRRMESSVNVLVYHKNKYITLMVHLIILNYVKYFAMPGTIRLQSIPVKMQIKNATT